MKIAYKNNQIYLNLFLGILWLINGIYKVFISENPHWFDGIWFLLSACYFTLFYYQKFKSYLIISSDYIKENWPFGKKIKFADITRVRQFAGDYIIETENKKLTINTQLIHQKSLVDLKVSLNKLTVD